MKLGRIVRNGPDGEVTRIVVVDTANDRVIDAARAYALTLQRRGATPTAAARLAASYFPASMSTAIAAGPAFRDAAETALAAADDASITIADAHWTAAVDSPVIRDSLQYPLHMQQFGAKLGGGLPDPQIFKTPPYFKGSTGVLYGHDEILPYPSFTDFLDYELEIGFVVGSAGRNLNPESAGAAIFGATIFNDFSARDIQGAEMGVGMGPQKCKDFGYGIGPWITTWDELPPVDSLGGSITVNGELWSTCVAEGMVFTPEELVAWVSVSDNLQPGDLIASGTLGNGSALEIGKKLSPGDILELQLDGIGTLRTPIGAIETAPWWPTEKPYPWAEQVAAT